MAKKNKRAAAAPVAQPARSRFPGWLVWGAFLLWGGWVFKTYLSAFPPDVNSLFVMLAPAQYLGPGLLKALWGHLTALLAGAFFVLACAGLGRFLLGAVLKPGRLTVCEDAAFSAALGFGVFGHLVLLLAAFGLLSAGPVTALQGAGIILGVAANRRFSIPGEENAPEFRPLFPDLLAMVLLGGALLLNLAAALSPEIFYDSLVYHLAVPNFYAIKGRLADMPYNLYSNLFLLHGMLYSAGLLLRDEMVPKLVNYAAGLLSLAAVLGIGRRWFSPRAGLWAGLIFYTVTHAMLASWSSGTEWLLTLFAVCSLAAALRHEPGEYRFLLLAAFLSGCGMAVKTTGLFPAVGTGLVLLWRSRLDRGAALRAALVFVLVAALPVLPWLVKNWLYRGNPFFPFLTSVFGLSGADPAKLSAFMVETRQMGAVQLKAWLLHPWNVTMGALPNSQYFTPLFLALLPLLFLLEPVGTLPLWLYFLCGWLLWSFASTMVRFLMPAYPAAALLIAAALEGEGRPALKKTLYYLSLLACALSLYWAGIIFYSQGRWRPVFGVISRDAYLSDTQPTYPYSHYAALRFINEKLPPGAKTLIIGDARSFYLKKDFVVSSVFDKTPIVEYALAAADGEALYARLRAEGVTHLLINAAEGIKLGQGYGMFYWDGRARGVFDAFWDRHVREVFSRDEAMGGRFLNRVTVYELADKLSAGERPPLNLLRDVVMKNVAPGK
ncbi:MAG: glycosyltransferase family 39 protein [Elusimicrobiales bacterium]|nr:glycosyltransferase family 39 protein [Elusimicrobiales bacterium]